MALPALSPASTTNRNVLPISGTVTNVSPTLPFGIYAGSNDFLSGATDQVAYTYKKLGGDVLDIELTEGNVYAAYEEAVLEYSYIVNLHQSKNILSNVLGDSTGSFDQDGELKSGDALSSSLGGGRVELMYPKFDYGFQRRVMGRYSTDAGLGGDSLIYSASFSTSTSQQDYDLQQIISSSAATDTTLDFFGKVNNKKVIIRKVYYKTSRAMWRFYGYYGGFHVVGNMRTYGQYADDSTFEVVPVWHNKLQAMAYEDAIWSRTSHYSYELKNNKIRIFPIPDETSPRNFWVEFTVEEDAWVETSDRQVGIQGINNMNTLPFANIPYENINSIGKQWIRRFGLSLAKEMLAQIRGKFTTIPIPGESVTMNADQLLSQAKEEQEKLREELKTTLDELTYAKLSETNSTISDNTENTAKRIPTGIYVG